MVMSLVCALGLADLTRVAAARAQAQTAADAAALAAAYDLAYPVAGIDPAQAAAAYAEANGASIVRCACAPGQVRVEVTVRLPVGSMLLVRSVDEVRASAVAAVSVPVAGG